MDPFHKYNLSIITLFGGHRHLQLQYLSPKISIYSLTQEQKCSTVIIMIKFILNNAIIISITVLLGMLIGYSEKNVPVYGLKGIWFNMLTKYCYFNNQGNIKFCCFPWKIKKIVYPFVLLIVITTLQWKISLEMIVGLLMAFLEIKLEVLFSPCSSKSLYERLSKLMPCASM